LLSKINIIEKKKRADLNFKIQRERKEKEREKNPKRSINQKEFH